MRTKTEREAYEKKVEAENLREANEQYKERNNKNDVRWIVAVFSIAIPWTVVFLAWYFSNQNN